jgi:leucyl/phenylalanyl-tRNA--protein transferase
VENRKEMTPAWITGKFKKEYLELDQRGYVHSIILKQEERLIGAAFGVRLGQMFFMEYVSGEKEEVREDVLSRFVSYLKEKGVQMIDLHKETNLTNDVGFSEISRNEYLDLLKKWI